jgi:hypothetical protein
MVPDAGEVVENQVYSDGIPEEYRRENGFGRVTERFTVPTQLIVHPHR